MLRFTSKHNLFDGIKMSGDAIISRSPDPSIKDKDLSLSVIH